MPAMSNVVNCDSQKPELSLTLALPTDVCDGQGCWGTKWGCVYKVLIRGLKTRT